MDQKIGFIYMSYEEMNVTVKCELCVNVKLNKRRSYVYYAAYQLYLLLSK